MRSNLFQAREVTQSENGSRVVVLQDGPSSFHVTIQNQDNIVYEHFENLSSVEELRNNINLLEYNVLNRVDFCANP